MTASAYYATDIDGKRYQRTILIITALAFGQLALAILKILPFWVMAITMPILIPRWMLAVHELFHVRKPHQINFITRLLPMAFTPFVLGYSEHQVIHAGHHEFMCSENDPEMFQLRGGYLTGLLNAMTMPEQAPVRWIAKNGIDRQLAITLAVNAIIFFTVVYLAGWNFLWYWIPTRISYGLASFAFFYLLHRRGNDYGVYSLQLPAVIAKLYAALFGKEALLVTCNHDVHHGNPRIAGYALEMARSKHRDRA